MRLADILHHVEELQRSRQSFGTAGTLGFQRQVELPRAAAHGLELIHVIVKKAAMVCWRLCRRLAQEQRADVMTVDGESGQGGTGECRQRGRPARGECRRGGGRRAG